jgi:hypothetical protein
VVVLARDPQLHLACPDAPVKSVPLQTPGKELLAGTPPAAGNAFRVPGCWAVDCSAAVLHQLISAGDHLAWFLAYCAACQLLSVAAAANLAPLLPVPPFLRCLDHRDAAVLPTQWFGGILSKR